MRKEDLVLKCLQGKKIQCRNVGEEIIEERRSCAKMLARKRDFGAEMSAKNVFLAPIISEGKR
jgi:hypothetical protein